jgi:hypothetical protein
MVRAVTVAAVLLGCNRAPRVVPVADREPDPPSVGGPASAPSAPPSSPPLAPPTATPSTASPDVDRVARCVTSAVETLGWYPGGAHAGHFMKTALRLGRVGADCGGLAADGNVWDYPISRGRRVQFGVLEETTEGDTTTLRLAFGCKPECGVEETRVTLPLRWHCFSWVHLEDSGGECHPTHAACEESRVLREGATTPCSLEPHAVWCVDAARGPCLPDPWACEREAGRFLRDARCVRRP